jgi:hypothetical protein
MVTVKTANLHFVNPGLGAKCSRAVRLQAQPAATPWHAMPRDSGTVHWRPVRLGQLEHCHNGGPYKSCIACHAASTSVAAGAMGHCLALVDCRHSPSCCCIVSRTVPQTVCMARRRIDGLSITKSYPVSVQPLPWQQLPCLNLSLQKTA